MGSAGTAPARRTTHPRLRPSGPLARLLLLDGVLGRRAGLEPAVGDRVAALHGAPVGARLQPGLGALQRGHLLAQILDATRRELVFVEVLGALFAGLAL